MGVERSHLVGLICWVLILGGLGGLALAMKAIGTPAFAGWLALYPFSPAVTATLAFGLRALLVATGICLYERQGWARYVYIALMPAFFIFQFLGLGQATNATRRTSWSSTRKYWRPAWCSGWRPSSFFSCPRRTGITTRRCMSTNELAG